MSEKLMPTPRTDALIDAQNETDVGLSEGWHQLRDLARQLERELAEAQQKRDEYSAQLDEALSTGAKLAVSAIPEHELMAVWNMLLLDGSVDTNLRGAAKLRALIDALIEARRSSTAPHDAILEAAATACDLEAAKYSQQGLQSMAVRGALGYAAEAIRKMKLAPASASTEPKP